ncbi:MAG: hypothetical protein LBT54_03205, partial [Bifidobacteriaceae bacterium]|nr:hypothetical protein [Bifidobacteriaceae bacterium]
MGYMPRVVDRVLDELLLGLPAVVIDGPKAVGKTATARRRVRSRIDLDEPGEVELLRADRRRILELPHPLLVDEWQRHPPVWDQVRRAAD